MHINDEQVVIWSIWTGLTIDSVDHVQYSNFDHFGCSGGCEREFNPVSGDFLFGVRMGWWHGGPDDFLVYDPEALSYMAANVMFFSDETPN